MVFKAKFLEAMCENWIGIELEFPGGGGGGAVQNKNLPWEEYGYFLALHFLAFRCSCFVSSSSLQLSEIPGEV